MPDWNPHVVSVEGRFVSASNATLLGTTETGDRVVYKPVAGERPLWDFAPESLAVREVLTYEVDEALGFGLVPETVLGTGMYGPGSVQRFVEMDEGFDPLALVRAGDGSLWPVAVLDLLTNNADRKLGHILRSVSGDLVAIDHGLTFHPEDKLRTVLWGFAGERAPDECVDAAENLAAALGGRLGARIDSLLGVAERIEITARTRRFTAMPVHPDPPADRPALPWPPY